MPIVKTEDFTYNFEKNINSSSALLFSITILKIDHFLNFQFTENLCTFRGLRVNIIQSSYESIRGKVSFT